MNCCSVTVFYASAMLFFINLECASAAGLTSGEISLFTASNSYSASITVTTQTDTYQITSTGMPDHATQKVNPNDPTDQNHNLTVPKTPTVKSTKGCLPMGKIGLTTTGVSIYNPLAEGYVNAVEGSKKETFDSCKGHPTNKGDYHYHQLPDTCLWDNQEDQLIGVAADGFPIYGPNISGIAGLLQSSDLDSCHGKEINGNYRYISTYDFPYIIGCFHGEVLDKSIGTSYVCKNTSTFDNSWGYLCSCHEYEQKPPGSASGIWATPFYLSVLAGISFLLS